MISSDQPRGRGRAPSRAGRPRRLERPAEGDGARRPRRRRRRCGRAPRRQLRRRRRRGRVDALSRPEPCCGSRRAPAHAPSSGSTVTLTVARAPEWDDDVVAERQRRVRLRGDRGDGAAGRLAHRRRGAAEATSSSAPGRRPSRGRERARGTSPSTRAARTRSPRSAAPARTGCTCNRTGSVSWAVRVEELG